MADYAHACDEIRQYEQTIALARLLLEQSDPDSLEARVVADALGRAAAVAESMTADLCPQRVQAPNEISGEVADRHLSSDSVDDVHVLDGRFGDQHPIDKKADSVGDK